VAEVVVAAAEEVVAVVVAADVAADTRIVRTLTEPAASARFEQAAEDAAAEYALKKPMISRTLLLGLLLLSLTKGGS
jgi:hypothetical protein